MPFPHFSQILQRKFRLKKIGDTDNIVLLFKLVDKLHNDDTNENLMAKWKSIF